ncbi:MAG: sulfatase-like hydrolase/transferase [Nitrospiraceae bacterium]|nr:sulfatase-like hydrolase/transferase [Nitrospiraceae bacterium]
MKAIMLMFDSLNRHMLPPYGCDWVHAPNFQRLAERTVTFDRAYVGSMPCMPARRELHTGRLNFLHRGWGPIEPFDDSMPQMLKNKGIYTHLSTDHYHYWEDGGATYHERYSSFELVRGQERDPWKAEVAPPDMPETIGQKEAFHWANRKHIDREGHQPQALTFANAIEFLDTNHTTGNWFLQIETFDPHEPFFAHQPYKDLYPHDYTGPHFDWPAYRPVEETPDQVQHCRYEYAALVSMCDVYLGKLLDRMDELDLWEDTMLIVNTDHGFLLGEHGWWAKNRPPWYEELSHVPLFIWDPRCRRKAERCDCLVQTIDLGPTLLEFFGVERSNDMLGVPLRDTIAADAPIRDAALFGIYGGHVNCTDGRYVYMRGPVSPDNGPLYDYTLMPTAMQGFFDLAKLGRTQLAGPFSFTKGCPAMKIPGHPWTNAYDFGTLLFDLEDDPQQQHPIKDPDIEQMMTDHLVRLMRENEAPPDQYERLGLPGDGV